MSEKYVRVRWNTLQTPIVGFDHQETESNINLVGMIHLGRQAYYDQIADYVREREAEGSIVHYELVNKTQNTEVETDPLLEEAKASLSSGMGMAIGSFAKHLGAVKQLEALKYPEHWENHDITMDELAVNINAEGIERMAQMYKMLEEAEESMGTEAFGRMIRMTFRFFPLISRTADKYGLLGKEFREVIIDKRNMVAVKAVEDAIAENPDQDVTMLWGAAHIPGIRQGLEALGYRKTREQWLGAISLKKPRV